MGVIGRGGQEGRKRQRSQARAQKGWRLGWSSWQMTGLTRLGLQAVALRVLESWLRGDIYEYDHYKPGSGSSCTAGELMPLSYVNVAL